MTKSLWFFLVAAGLLLTFGVLVIKTPRLPSPAQRAQTQSSGHLERVVKGPSAGSPAGEADADESDGVASPSGRRVGPPVEQRFSATLDDVAEQVKRARATISVPARERAVAAIAVDEKKLNALRTGVQQSFAATEHELEQKQVPAEFLQRHRHAVDAFEQRMNELEPLMAALSADGLKPSQLPAKLNPLGEFFERYQQARPRSRLDPHNLPFRSASADKTRQPVTRDDDAQVVAGLSSALTFSAAPSTSPQSTDLAETIDARITPAIRALAATLHDNPVEIFNWVRNNVEWLPTYGSVQGAEVTRVSRRGNAFDTSSLLIALYRAAGIPCRYVYGTIEVPVNRALNWVGGAARAEAAQQILGQGGIPNIAMIQGSTVRSIRVEHVWVEAFVDFEPSRGAINRSPETWVALDPSFKQYELAPPTDWKTSLTVDPAQVTAQVATGAVVGQNGSLTGLNVAAIDTWSATLVEQFGAGLPVPGAAEVVGTRRVIAEDRSVLPASLPNKVVTRSGSFAALPSNLRHTITLELYSSSLDEGLGSASVSYTAALPDIAGKRLGITYAPATAADATALASYRTTRDGSLPLYLFRVRPLIQLDGVEVARGPVVTMGEAQRWNVRLDDPSAGVTHQHAYSVTAGDELVFGVNGNGVTDSLIHERFARTPSETAAENLHTIALYYWAQHDALNAGLAASTNVLVQRLPSVGLFKAPLTVEYLFGLPRNGFYSPRHMDVAHSIVAAAERSNGSTREFHRSSGLAGSLFEGRTFDTVLGREQGAGVSAVQLLREADQQKIPIHLVSGDNFDELAPSLQLDADVLADVRSAVLQGKEVLIPERAPFHGDWQGVGYIIDDPSTGAGAYMISGGLSGGGDDPCDPERQTEPVHVPVFEIALLLFMIALMIAIIIFMPEIILGLGTALARSGPLLARVAMMLGVGASASPAAAAVGLSPFPGDGLAPPGDCTPEQYLPLKAAVDALCHGAPSCRQFPRRGANCAELLGAAERNRQCLDARIARETLCFRGGDRGHRIQIEDTENRVATCACRIAQNGCL
jgi:transglutaminase-like putative cysteine protease